MTAEKQMGEGEEEARKDERSLSKCSLHPGRRAQLIGTEKARVLVSSGRSTPTALERLIPETSYRSGVPGLLHSE